MLDSHRSSIVEPLLISKHVEAKKTDVIISSYMENIVNQVVDVPDNRDIFQYMLGSSMSVNQITGVDPILSMYIRESSAYSSANIKSDAVQKKSPAD